MRCFFFIIEIIRAIMELIIKVSIHFIIGVSVIVEDRDIISICNK